MLPASFLREFAEVAAIRMPSRPRLAPWLTLVELGDGRLQLRALDFTFTIPGGLFADAARVVLPLLDGTHAIEQLFEAGLPRFLPGTIAFLLKVLRQRGVLQEGLLSPSLTTPLSAPQQAALHLLSHYVTDAEQVLRALAASTVALVGAPSLCDKLGRSLASLGLGQVVRADGDGIAVGETIASADLLIAVSETAGTAFFEATNAVCLENQWRWLRVCFEGRLGVLGPTIIPGQTACFNCLTLRRAGHDDWDSFQAYRTTRLKEGDPHEGALDPLTDTLMSQAALETARLLAGFAPPVTLGRLHTFEAGSPRVLAHEVLRVPRCSACGRRQSPRDPWDLRAHLV